MKMFSAFLALTFTLGYCSASPHFLDVNIDNVRKMVLEYDPMVRDQDARNHKRAEAEVAHHSLAVRQFQENIRKAKVGQAELIPDLAAKLGLTSLVDAVVQAKLKDTLESTGPFTVFGPTNEAFAKLPAWAKEEIKNVTVLAKILEFHVLPGKVFSSSLTNDLQVATALKGTKLRINIYTVNKNLVATAQCAPIDLKRVDQNATNGVIHVLNSVMIPPEGNIVDTAVACPVFTTLVKAVQVAGLVDTLKGPGPYTLFAPTNDAFSKLPPGTLEKLIKNPEKLAQILKYHVVSGTFCSAGLTSGSVKTVQGQDVIVKVTSDGVVVNNSKVISADGSVTNGVVHAIDSVLLPPGLAL